MLRVLDRFQQETASIHDSFLFGNEIIEAAICKYRNDSTKENLVGVLEAIRIRMRANGHFMIPVITTGNNEFAFRTLQTTDGKEWLVAFTTHREYAKGEPSEILSNFIDTTLRACIDNDGTGFIINPWEAPFMLSKELIAMMFEADAQCKDPDVHEQVRNITGTPKLVIPQDQFLSSDNEELDAAMLAIEGIFAAAKGAKGANRHAAISELVPKLPTGYRIVAQVADQLPEDEVLDKLAEQIDLLLHGIIIKEAYGVCREYTEYRRRNHIISLDDMMNLTASLVRNHPEVRLKLHARYRTFFVDEYQDTDPIQTDIIFAITADQYDPDWHKCVPRPGSLFLVGDAKQGIYRFRGADISLWQEAEEAMEATGGEVVYLSKNFRSTTEICDAVTEIFGEGGSLPMEKGPYQAAYNGMVAHRGHGPEAVFHHTINCDDVSVGHEIAAKQIAQMIQNRVESGQNQYEDFLLLSFFRERNIAYADELRKRHIPVKFDGALPIDAYPPIQLAIK